MRHDVPSQHNPNCPPILTSLGGMHTPNSSESDVTPSHSHALEEMHNMTFAELY